MHLAPHPIRSRLDTKVDLQRHSVEISIYIRHDEVMNFSRRGFLALAGAAAAVTGLSACGKNNGGLGSSSSGSSSTSQATLSHWYHEYGEAGVQDAVKRYAAEYDKATINVVWKTGEYARALNSQLLTDDVPDVFEAEMGASLDMINSGQVVDLTDLMDPVKDQFNQPMLKRLTFKDKVWAIPQVIDMQLLYYRKSVLAAKGLSAPTTFAELVHAANEVATSSMGGFFAGNDGGLGVLASMLLWASGNDQLNADRSDLAFLTPEFYDALTQYRSFYNSNGLLKAASKEWYDGDPFANGETAMQWAGLWSLPQIKEALGDDFGVVPFPKIGNSGRLAVPFGAFSCCVAAKAKDVAAAKDYVKWLWIDSEDKQVEFADAFGTHIPSKPALADRCNQLKDGAGKEAAEFVAQHGFANDILWTGALGTAYADAVSRVVLNGADPASEFKTVHDTAKAELKRANA